MTSLAQFKDILAYQITIVDQLARYEKKAKAQELRNF